MALRVALLRIHRPIQPGLQQLPVPVEPLGQARGTKYLIKVTM